MATGADGADPFEGINITFRKEIGDVPPINISEIGESVVNTFNTKFLFTERSLH
jgi:hypothetical protein